MFLLSAIFPLFNTIDMPDFSSLSSSNKTETVQEYNIPNNHSDIPSNKELGIPQNATNIVHHQEYASYDIVKNDKNCHVNISYDLQSSSQLCQ